MKQQLVKGVAWLSAAKLIVNGLSTVSTLILARYLTPDDFGLVAFATTMLTVITSVTELSLASALIHHRNPSEVHYNTAWTLNFLRSLTVGGLFCLAATWVSDLHGDPRLQLVMMILGASLALNGFANPKMVVLTKNLVFWQEFVRNVAERLVGVTVGIVIAVVYQSYWALIASTVASQLVSILVSYLVYPYRPKVSFKHATELWSFSIWLTLGQIVNTLNWKFDHLLVGFLLGNKLLGYYTVGDNLSTKPTREMIAPLETTLFPGFSRIGDDKQRLKNAYRKAQTLVALIALPLGVGIALVSSSIILLFLGERWEPVILVMQIMAGSVAIQTLSSAVQPLALSQGQTKLLFKRDLISFAIRVPLIAFGLWYAGLLGVLIGRAVSTLISVHMNMTIVRMIIGTSIRDQWWANIRSLGGLVSMIIVVIFAQYLLGLGHGIMEMTTHLVIFIALGVIAYGLTILGLWMAYGKPEGPEGELINGIQSVFSKLKIRFK
ncbi:lipopolysaccharide biosynthesis protein [Methylovorus mays]|uniref:lipopolysaccharide biosynthesis protein n=1 Tax=Methylovorus mays TaxID=184077 RepID=UPI001E4F1C8D|nr:lipopolysaccharide biosynthesis protein [Methylovorus mays]MCB5205686.1 lipopolysaccharide biosynthesis protein [Methylovorus mays]